MSSSIEELFGSIVDSDGVFDDMDRLTSGLSAMSVADNVKAKRELKRIGLTTSEVADFSRAVKEKRKELSKSRDSIASGLFSKVSEMNTYPYRDDNGTTAVHTAKMSDGEITESYQPVCEFVGRIKAQMYEEGGDSHVVIAIKTKSGAEHDVKVSSRDFASNTSLISEIINKIGGSHCVYAGMEKHVRASISKMSTDVDIDEFKLYRRTGWVDGAGDGFICEGIAPENCVMEIHSQLPYSLPPAMDEVKLAEGVSAIGQLTDFNPTAVTTMVCSALSAPAMKGMGAFAKRFITFAYGKTGSLKTEVTKLIMCIYGSEFIHDHNLIEWGDGATRASMRGMAGVARDLPLFIDNYKPQVGGGERAYTALAHSVVEGRDKMRTTVEGKQRETNIYRTMLIFTGEDLASSDPASLARTVAVPFPITSNSWSTEVETTQALYKTLPFVGRSWIEWLSDEDNSPAIETLCEGINDRRKAWVTFFSGMEGEKAENGKRIASNLATLETVWEMAKLHPYIGVWAKAYDEDFSNSLLDIANRMAKMTAGASEAKRFVAGLREMIASGTAVVIRETGKDPDPETKVSDKFIGWMNEKTSEVYVLPQKAVSMYKLRTRDDLNNASPQKLYTEMFDNEYIKYPSTKNNRLGASRKQQRVLVFNKDVLI